MSPAVFRKATNRNAICRQSPPHLPLFATQNTANRKAPGNQAFTNTHKQYVKTAARHDPDSGRHTPQDTPPLPRQATQGGVGCHSAVRQKARHNCSPLPKIAKTDTRCCTEKSTTRQPQTPIRTLFFNVFAHILPKKFGSFPK